MIQKQFFHVFELFVRRSNISVRKTLERIRISYLFSENDLKHEMTLAKYLLRKGLKLPMSLEQFFPFLLKKLRLIVILVAVTLPVTSALRKRRFAKMKVVKTFSRDSMTSERLGNFDLVSTESYQLKNRFRWFRWPKFGSRYLPVRVAK